MVDSTVLFNKRGIDEVSKYHTYRKKKATKVNIVCDTNKIILSHDCADVKVHDTKLTMPSLEKIKFKNKNITLLGDKGYISKKNLNFRGNTVRLVTPKRKNQKTQNTEEDKKILKLRIYVEHTINLLKNNIRAKHIRGMLDRTLKSLDTIFYLMCLIHNDKILNPNKT